MNRNISGIVLSDIHLGSSRNSTEYIVFNLKYEIFKHPDIDIIFIAGDLYDRVLSFSSEDAKLSVDFILWLTDFCIKHNIILRILEGTPSHDFGQASMFTKILKEKSINFRYIDDISTEYIDSLGINILYVPDEPRPTMVETMDAINRVIDGVEIDIAIMHGQFHYQLPFDLDSSYNESDFDFVKYFIFIGHVHTYNPNGKIIPQGSFDRLAFGEDEDKGYVKFRINPTTGASYQFIPNKRAMKFKTIRIDTDKMDHATKLLLDIIRDYDSRYLRLSIPYNSTLDSKILSDIARKNNIILTIKRDKREEQEIDIEEEVLISKQISITEYNVRELLLDKIDLDESEIDIFDIELKELL